MNERSNQWRDDVTPDGTYELKSNAPPVAPPVLADPQMPVPPPLPDESQPAATNGDWTFSLIAAGVVSVACIAVATLTYSIWNQLDQSRLARLAERTPTATTPYAAHSESESNPESAFGMERATASFTPMPAPVVKAAPWECTKQECDDQECTVQEPSDVPPSLPSPPRISGEQESSCEIVDSNGPEDQTRLSDEVFCYAANHGEKLIEYVTKHGLSKQPKPLNLVTPSTCDDPLSCATCESATATSCPTGGCEATAQSELTESELTESELTEEALPFGDFPLDDLAFHEQTPSEQERRYGTELIFADSFQTARKQAVNQDKLILVLHVSGNFAIEGFT